MIRNIILKDNERLDDLEIKSFKLFQNKDMFCYGVDAVLLSDFTKAKADENVLDLCTGNGVIPILMHAKDKGNKFLGIDIIPENIELANKSLKYNDIENISFICEDIKKLKSIVKSGEYNLITCNPPYMVDKSGYKNKNVDKLVARHEIKIKLDEIFDISAGALQTKGRLYMIHRPNRIPDIMYLARKYRLEPKRMVMVHSMVNKEPSMVLIEFVKDAKADLKVEKPLIIYKEDGEYTEELLKIYNK
jgi:tRNA1Val (adenine37-N6)-methyltransferase